MFLTNLTHLIKGEIDFDKIKVKTNRFKDSKQFERNWVFKWVNG